MPLGQKFFVARRTSLYYFYVDELYGLTKLLYVQIEHSGTPCGRKLVILASG